MRGSFQHGHGCSGSPRQHGSTRKSILPTAFHFFYSIPTPLHPGFHHRSSRPCRPLARPEVRSNTAMVVPGDRDSTEAQEKHPARCISFHFISFHSHSTPSRNSSLIQSALQTVGKTGGAFQHGHVCSGWLRWHESTRTSILSIAFHFIAFHSNSIPSRNSSSIQSALHTVGKTGRDRRCVPAQP